VLPASENDHNVTGLLKMWIRDLPDPLLTYGHYPEWIELGNRVVGEKESGGNMARLLPQVQKLILALPETNRYVMQVLFKLLSCVRVSPADVSRWFRSYVNCWISKLWYLTIVDI
jgi:hypothetical protein